jgi:O-antigen/teichoic acid export membrane protein
MSDNKRIAKNSVILYMRLLVTTAIGLYTSRIILLELGMDDFGLYAVVGGIVAMMNLMSTTMVSASNRFIAVEIGKKDNKDTNKIFNTLIVLHVFFGILLLVIVEVVGVWYVNNYLNVAKEKIPDALFVLHLSAIAAFISTANMPFQGLITMHEKFNVKALIEVIHSLLHLGVVVILIYHTGNKLRAYAFYVLIVQTISALIYFMYGKIKYSEIAKWRINRNWDNYQDISRFFGWQLIYVAGAVGYRQGGAIILNLFFGTVLNAAFGIATKVNEFLFAFVKNLNQAAVPQIMKSYGGGNQARSLTLVYKLCKFTFFLMLIPAVPIILSIDTILVLWLKEVPKYTAWFVALRMLSGLVSSLESGFDATIDATGNIRKTKTVFSLLFLSTLPLVYVLYKLNFPPYTIAFLAIIGEIIFLIVQTRILTALTNFKTADYFSKTIMPVALVTVLIIPQYFLRFVFGEGIFNLFGITLVSLILTIITIYIVGLNKEEKTTIQTNVVKIPIIKRVFSKKPIA